MEVVTVPGSCFKSLSIARDDENREIGPKQHALEMNPGRKLLFGYIILQLSRVVYALKISGNDSVER